MGTIVSVERMWSRDAGEVRVSDDGRQFVVAYKEAYQVVCSADTTPIEAHEAPGIPAANSIYPGTAYVACKSAAPVRVSPIMYIVSVDYAGDPNPLAMLPEIDWGSEASDEAIDEDYDGAPIVTANGEPIEGITRKVHDMVLSVRRNYSSFDSYLTHEYLESTNSDTFYGYPPGMARMTDFNAKLMTTSSSQYWDVSARIVFRWPYRTTPGKAWYARVRHEGFYILAGGLRRRATENDVVSGSPGEPVVKPVLLKSTGVIETNSANAHWLEFKRYGSLPYNALGLA